MCWDSITHQPQQKVRGHLFILPVEAENIGDLDVSEGK